MKFLKITLSMYTALFYQRRVPTLDGILACEVISQQGLQGNVDVTKVLKPYLAFVTHRGLQNPVPCASQALVTEAAESTNGKTIIGSFVKKLRDDYNEVEFNKPIGGLMNRAIGDGWGAKSYIKNTQTKFNSLLAPEVIFFVLGDPDGITEILSNTYSIGSKRSVGNGQLAKDGDEPRFTVLELDEADGYETTHPGLVNADGDPIRPIPMSVWQKLFKKKMPSNGSMVLEESYFPPYFNSQKVACWTPPSIKLADVPGGYDVQRS